MHITKVINNDGSAEIYFEHLNYWEEYEVILKVLEKEKGCQILSEQDIEESRKAILRFKSLEFNLCHNYILGNFIYTINLKDIPTLEQLANDVIKNIKNKLDKSK